MRLVSKFAYARASRARTAAFTFYNVHAYEKTQLYYYYDVRSAQCAFSSSANADRADMLCVCV